MNPSLAPTEVVATLPAVPSGGGSVAPTSEIVAFIGIIERAARDPSIDIDKLDRLLLMRERENARVAEQTFNAAMAAAQAEMEPIRFDSSNDQTRSRYASYAALDRTVRPIYTRHGFALEGRREAAYCRSWRLWRSADTRCNSSEHRFAT